MRTYLKQGYTIVIGQKEYVIDGVIGSGASSTAYNAYTLHEGEKNPFVIKEYNPGNIQLVRDLSGKITWSEQDNEKFLKGLERFKASIEVQIRIRNEKHTQNQTFCITDHFDYNNTYYIVMPAQYGQTYDKWVNRPLRDKLIACQSIARYVKKCHENGYLCLDLKPDNIFVLEDLPEVTMYFDFDSIKRKNTEVKYGDFSYTEKWAAPEQKTPSEYQKISEATDVYLIGEIVFWSVFARNSTPDEHCRTSYYDFDSSENPILKDDAIKRLLSEIFKNSIRSSSDNRFKNMAELIKLLKKIIDVINTISRGLKTTEQVNNECIGRTDEVKWITEFFANKAAGRNCCFLIGEEGIGKKSIVYKYAYENREIYRHQLFLKFHNSLVTTIFKTAFTLDFKNHINENAFQCSKRKLQEYKNKFDFGDRALIVIEDFNIEIESQGKEDAELFEMLKNMPCDIIILSNKVQKYPNCLDIGPLGISEIKQLLALNDDYESSQEAYFIKLMNKVGYNTYCIKLIQNQMKFKGTTPEVLFYELEKIKIPFMKEDTESFDRKVIELYKIILNYDINDNQLELLIKSCFLPNDGVNDTTFNAVIPNDDTVYEFTEHIDEESEKSDLQLLVDIGLIKIDDDYIVSVDPIISKTVLSCNAYAESKIVKVLSSFSDLSDRVNILPLAEIEFSTFRKISEGIITKIREYALSLECCGDYIVKHVLNYRSVLLPDESFRLLEYSISIYNAIIPISTYNRGREMAYLFYYDLLYKTGDQKKAKSIYDEHYKKSKKQKDTFLKLHWKLTRNCLRITDNSNYKNQGLLTNMYKGNNAYAMSYHYSKIRKWGTEIAGKYGHVYLDTSHLLPGLYIILDFLDKLIPECIYRRSFFIKTFVGLKKKMCSYIMDVAFENIEGIVSKEKPDEKSDYLSNIDFYNNNKNSKYGVHYINVSIANAYMLYIDGLTNQALDELKKLLPYICYETDSILYANILSMYGIMAYESQKYSVAAEALKKLFDYCVTYNIEITKEPLLQLQEAYIELNDLKSGKKIEESFLEIENDSAEDNVLISSVILYNKAMYYIQCEDFEKSKDYLQDAYKKIESICPLSKMPKIIAWMNGLALKHLPWTSSKKYVILSRIYQKYGEIHLKSGELRLARKYIKKSKRIFKFFFGADYHETSYCNFLLKNCVMDKH